MCVEIHTLGPSLVCRIMYLWYKLLSGSPPVHGDLSLQRMIIGNDMGFSIVPAVGARLLTSYLLVSLVFLMEKMFDVSFHMLKTY